LEYREPQKMFQGVFNVRLDQKSHQKIFKEALQSAMSLNAFINQTLKNSLQHTTQ